jgi:glyoxylase-like metal-dependent hydrolase (beta-lactamase superfamily II)
VHVTYTQLNKDAAFWAEKLAAGYQRLGGHTSGLFTCRRCEGGQQQTVYHLLVDAGLGTIQALCEAGFDWEADLDVLITHGHADHHIELKMLSRLYCRIMPERPKPPLTIHCTQETFDHWLRPLHGFESDDDASPTLRFHPISPVTTQDAERASLVAGPDDLFHVRAVATDHLPGAVIYVVEFDDRKVLTGWDLRSLPDPGRLPLLQQPSLALLEANTLYADVDSGHTSAQTLVESGFLAQLAAPVSGPGRHGIYLVHFSGRTNASVRNWIADDDLLPLIRSDYPETPASLKGVARRLQSWEF